MNAARSRPVAVGATLGLAALAWMTAVGLMRGMDLGIATPLGPLVPFLALWSVMVAAMMLPGAAVAIARVAAAERSGAVARFVGAYLGVWWLVGVAVYVLYQPHGTVAAGVVVIAAGAYELTPLKRRLRQRCRDTVHSGLDFGLSCAGSCFGLMLLPLALGVMSLTWMAVAAVLVLVQRLLPARAGIDLAVALAIVGLGLVIVACPGAVPKLMPALPMPAGHPM